METRDQISAPGPSRPMELLALNGLFLAPQLCPGHGGSWQDSYVPLCVLVPLASGCANGESCGRGYLVVILESISATQAKMVRPGISHPSCLRCGSGPDPAPFSQCPKCCAVALSLSRPTVWWMESTVSQACPPTSRGFGEHSQPAFLSTTCPSPVLHAGSHLWGAREAQCNGDLRRLLP